MHAAKRTRPGTASYGERLLGAATRARRRSAPVRHLLGSGSYLPRGHDVNDPSDRKRTNEEEYFQKRDRELIEQMRQRAKAQQQLRELGEQVGVTDPELSRELAEMGFTVETVKLLPLIPVLEMAGRRAR